MIVLGISETHCATAAVLRDGEIVGCASEERFSRLKNDAGYPRLAVDALLKELAPPMPSESLSNLAPFTSGLYACTEMFVEALLGD